MIGWLIDFHRRACSRYMSRCRICGSSRDVISYDPRGLWAFPIRNTYCPEHCPDHSYAYSRYDGYYCESCGQSPDPDWYSDHFEGEYR